jgi:hypothetical protein
MAENNLFAEENRSSNKAWITYALVYIFRKRLTISCSKQTRKVSIESWFKFLVVRRISPLVCKTQLIIVL